MTLPQSDPLATVMMGIIDGVSKKKRREEQTQRHAGERRHGRMAEAFDGEGDMARLQQPAFNAVRWTLFQTRESNSKKTQKREVPLERDLSRH